MIKYFLCFFLVLTQLFAAAQQPAYKNKNLSPGVRAKDLLSRMTLDEKAMQIKLYNFCLQQSKIIFCIYENKWEDYSEH
jgi:hypothetical protein